MPYGPHGVRVERDLAIPMRDGTRQFADVHLPADVNAPLPAILERTPYSKDNSSEIQMDAHNFFASHGYAVVVSDVRGRFRGEGEFYPFRDDPNDGYDTIEWIAAQPWCNGNVGMMGGSYSGVTQYQVAPTRPPHLRCLYCRQSSSDYQQEWVFRGGAFELGFMWAWTVKWLLMSGGARGDVSPTEAHAMEAALASVDEWHGKLPLAPLSLVAARPGERGQYDWFNEWLDRCDDAALWNIMNLARRHAEIDVPIMHLGGWFDIFQRGTFDHFLGIRAKARSARARKGQRLLVGPWIHGPKQIRERVQGEIDFGPDAAQDFNELRLPWYDFWLKGLRIEDRRSKIATEREADPRSSILDPRSVRLFVMGANEWRDFEDWPPPGVEYTDFYFSGGPNGSAQSRNDGTLTLTPPSAREAPDSYDYDPLHPTPSLGGSTLNLPGGPRDQREAELSSLTFTSEPLTEDLTVIGPVRCILYASSSCRDTDWVVKLCDVYPEAVSPPHPVSADRQVGPSPCQSVCMADGILRARYRESRLQPSLLEPGHVYRFEVDLWSTAHVFKRVHRVRVSVCSSNFPRFDRNLNTGARLYFDGKCEIARNTVYHDAQHPSRVVLPVMRAGAVGGRANNSEDA